VLNQSRPGLEILLRFHAAGMSIDWLLTGHSRWVRETIVHQPVGGETYGAITDYLNGLLDELKKQQNSQKPRDWR
jgi:hypothetical protein